MLLMLKHQKYVRALKEGGVGIRIFIFLSGKLLYFFLALCDYSDKLPKIFCSSRVMECLSTANFCHQCGQQLNWVRSRIRRQVRLTRKNCYRSISIGDILTQPSLVCWKNVMEYECTWGCERKLKNRPRKLRPVRRCFRYFLR